MPCIKTVVIVCPRCDDRAIKFGKTGASQRYRCKSCKITFLTNYIDKARDPAIDKSIIDHLTEGCGIRSIERLLSISATTVLRSIKQIAACITKPVISTGRKY